MDGFSGMFAERINSFLDYRAACGFKRETYLRHFIKFDRWCIENHPGAAELGRELVHEWIDDTGASNHEISHRAAAMRHWEISCRHRGKRIYPAGQICASKKQVRPVSFYRFRIDGPVSPNTIRSYREALELLVDYVKDQKQIPLGNVTFEMLTADMILAFLDYLETERGCSVSTRNNRLAAIRAFIGYAADRDITTVPVQNELKKIPVKKPDKTVAVEYMSMEAISAIVGQADADTPKGLRDRFFMILMYDTGARIQEMIDIKLCDLQTGRLPKVTLHGKGRKTRIVPLMDKTARHLQKYLSVFHSNAPVTSDTPLFYTVIHGVIHPLTDRRIRYLVKKYGEKARPACPEVPENVHPHLFRHYVESGKMVSDKEKCRISANSF